MPKLIPNLRSSMIGEARRQVFERGYAATTIRSIANACGVGIGTVYNYFPSKDVLIGSFMLEDWTNTIDEINRQILAVTSTYGVLSAIFGKLRSFITEHKTIFSDPDAMVIYAANLNDKHPLMRNQIATLIETYCFESKIEDKFRAQFLAESLMTWAAEEVSFETIYKIMISIIPKGENQ